ncbi:integrase [Blautia sp. An249]|uniref:tyrosine-type recombinase/integrase n=1 Tax=Blautia sp. An249 TaxID=1965603 RepID=UPI000B36F7FD|nr:site-specific integrase [Blautia sp. An249]OUO80804.1 integrase [Blautia sp. An249]
MAEGVRKRGKTWSYYFDTARINGERHKIEKGGFRTQKEALDARAAAIAEYNNTGRAFSPKDISVADYLDYWLETAIKKNIDHGYSYETWRDYESKIRLHLKPTFGIYRLSSFQYASDKVQEWVNNMKLKGFSKSMIKNTLTCLQGALNYAILPLKYIQANPCIPVKIGKMPIDVNAKEKIEYVCPKEEFERILARFPEDNYFHMSLLLPYYSGTRIGETFAIDLNEDVDFSKHELHINGQMRKRDKTWFIKPPKYESYRTIKIGNTLEQALKHTIKQRKINRLKYGQFYLKTYLLPDQSIVQVRADVNVVHKEIMPLCVKENGELVTPDSFKYCARVIHYELGNVLFHSHSLRHTHGTILAEKGVNPKTVMERLGHKNIETTLQTYTFNTKVMQQTAVDVFEKAM